MTPIKSPAWVGTVSTPGIIFFGKDKPTPKAHVTGLLMQSRVWSAFFPPALQLCDRPVEPE